MNGTDALFDMEEFVYEVSKAIECYTSHAVVDPGNSDVGTGQMAWERVGWKVSLFRVNFQDGIIIYIQM